MLFYASLLRISTMAEEFRAIRCESDVEKTDLLKVKDIEFGQIARDLNRCVQELSTNYHAEYHPRELIVKPMFLLRAYCGCLAMAVKPMLPSSFEPVTPAFREMIKEDWESALKNGSYAKIFKFTV